MNKVIKYKNTFSSHQITFTVDEKLNELEGKNLALKNWKKQIKCYGNSNLHFLSF